MLEGLDPEQLLAVTTASPLLIVAPAGSGKTRVLTRRIAYQIATGEIRASETVAISFTRSAAFEMRRRLSRLHKRFVEPTGGPARGAGPQRWPAAPARSSASRADRRPGQHRIAAAGAG